MLIFFEESHLNNYEEIKSSGNNCSKSPCHMHDKTTVISEGDVT
jgi:hypothetical protein